MLVLTGRKGEGIVIGDNIRITVLATQSNQTRLGIAAPPDIPVDREEIHAARRGDSGHGPEAGRRPAHPGPER
jgi:carbon storage regulator